MTVAIFRKFFVGTCALTAIMSSAANATETLSTPAASWSVQNYPGGVLAFLTGSVCANGGLTSNPSDSADRVKQLYATILAAKAMNARVSIAYEVSGNQCIISMFGVDSQ